MEVFWKMLDSDKTGGGQESVNQVDSACSKERALIRPKKLRAQDRKKFLQCCQHRDDVCGVF